MDHSPQKSPEASLLDEEIAIEQEALAGDVVDHSSIARLPSGFSLSNPNNYEQYTILEKLPSGGEGHTYLAQEQTGRKKVVKLVSSGVSTTSSELEKKLREEYRKLNAALGTKMTAFAANLLDVAIVNDYVEGQNLGQEIVAVDSVFNETQVVDFLLQITRNYLQPLHGHNLVHRDIKPQNIICTTENEERVYTLIDFGLLRKVSSSATITTTLSGTPGYTRIKADYECADDYYSLAKTAYFLFTGKDPEYVGHTKYDAVNDQEIFGALRVNDSLRKVLFRMLGHEQKNKYQTSAELIADLEGLQTTAGKNKAVARQDLGIDLNSAKILTKHREARELPLSLQQRINGLKQRFKEQYQGTLASRLELEDNFLDDLEEILSTLGYEQQGLMSIAQEGFDPFEGMNTYLRQHRDSRSIDVLLVNPTSQGEHHLQYCRVESLDEAAKAFSKYQLNQAYYTIPKRLVMWASTAAAVVYGSILGYQLGSSMGALGGLAAGLVTAYIAAQVNYKYPLKNGIYDDLKHPNFDRDPEHRMDESNSAWWGLLGLSLPHSIGKISYLVGNGLANDSHNLKTLKNEQALRAALKPATHFTYKRIEV